MTPKEKAEELVNKFETIQYILEDFTYDEAIECALMCVHELIQESISTGNFINKPYWEQVKKEIENL
jgi:hypothetical protein